MLVAIPFFPTPDSFQDNVASTLRAMGHEVLTPNRALRRAAGTVQAFLDEAIAKTLPERWSVAEKWLIGQVRERRVDMVLCLTQALRDEVLHELRRAGVARLVAWWGDPPANMRGLGLLSTGWDLIFIKDAAAVAKFRAVGLEAEHLHEAMNPKWHRRKFTKIGEEVVVAGNYYGYRQFLVERLIEAGEPIALYGPPLPRWARKAIRGAHRGRYIVKEEKSLIFGSGVACLNSTSLSEGNSLNCRAFEIAGACGLQLIEDKPVVRECFEPGRELLVYQSVAEVREHLAHARADRDWAMRIREAGYARARAHHTYEHRLRVILKRAGG